MRAPTVLTAALAASLVLAFGAAFSQDGAPVKTGPRLTGTPQPLALERVPARGTRVGAQEPVGRSQTRRALRWRLYPI